MKRRTGISQWIDPDGMFGRSVLDWVESHPGSVLLESNVHDGVNEQGFLFTDPVEIIQVTTVAEVVPALENIARALSKGRYAAGFISYEAGFAFEPSLPEARLAFIPLVWFGIFKEPVRLNHRTKRLRNAFRLPRFSAHDGRAQQWQTPVPTMSLEQYSEQVRTIHEYISAGDTYQVNYTFPLSLEGGRSTAARYDALRRSQRVPFSAFVNTGAVSVLSLSPELFFRKQGVLLTMKPMKGTSPRGRTTEEDEQRKQQLKESEKNRAENLMIVDLLRNDAGRIAVPGSVKVRKFFDIERYETVFQATSTIQATLRNDVGIVDVMRALFPSGSVTGAPKIRTMQIIHELEPTARGVYTGSIGYLMPNGDGVFSVAIRTVVQDHATERAVVGIGSGIVHDSDPAGEYDECILKARFLTEPSTEFQLMETILWNPSRGWFLLPLHLRRLKSSAAYFGFRCDMECVRKKLESLRRSFLRRRKPVRVTLLMSRNGSLEFRTVPMTPIAQGALAGLATQSTQSRDRFLFHKTTRRELYEQELVKAEAWGMFDVIFQNERGEVTEGARSNVMVRIEDSYFTPPLDSGLLPGTFRTHLLQSGKIPLIEKVLYPDDLASADEILLCNAVRGLISVRVSQLSPS